jgi:sulfotransferase family protein
VLPNLIVIGAAKCGTTSMHEYLALHPDIAMSAKKELNFFTRDDWRSQVEWYADQFADAPVRGESSPGYTLAPFLPSVAGRIHEIVPDCRLIYLVRDPVARTVANYTELVMHRLETRGINEALTDFADEANPHLCGSRFGSQIERFLEHFDRSRLLVLDQADLRRERRPTLRKVFEFLGVDADFDSPEFDRTHNTRRSKVRYNDLGMWLIRRGWFTESRGSVRGPLVQPLRRLLSTPIDDRLSPEARKALASELRPEVEKLTRLTGFQPRGWRV